MAAGEANESYLFYTTYGYHRRASYKRMLMINARKVGIIANLSIV